ncbi:hypothetical protein [Paenibacillus maysiensis]|nr:hypothetical protein [Paenibacillus maysiensis]
MTTFLGLDSVLMFLAVALTGDHYAAECVAFLAGYPCFLLIVVNE